uniref:Ig-like domain-containing protein n=1 Tax=Seriola dumerili TaxID=41447 RepID=A0A3B4TJY2_SERDU
MCLILCKLSDLPCYSLTQPASVTVEPGQRLTITCQVSYSLSSCRTHWIRQPVGKALEWFGSAHIGHGTYYKDSLKNKFSIDLDSSSKTVTLNGQNLQPEDTAVYYCAREPHHTITQTINLTQQPSVTVQPAPPPPPCSNVSPSPVTVSYLLAAYAHTLDQTAQGKTSGFGWRYHYCARSVISSVVTSPLISNI